MDRQSLYYTFGRCGDSAVFRPSTGSENGRKERLLPARASLKFSKNGLDGKAMSPPLEIRLLARTDLPFADSLRARAGWNQTPVDWERFLALAPEGCFLALWNGAPAGTATTMVYGPELAWIGMVLVHPDFRRRGIGGALLRRCIAHLQSRGVRCIKLDATPDGKPVYASLGFKAEWTLTRWERAAAPSKPAMRDPRVRTWQTSDAEAIEPFDAAAFGVSRRQLVETLAKQSRCGLVLETEPGRVAGYGLLRDGSRALYLGPIAAMASDVAAGLVEALLERGGEEKIFWDIPDQNAAAVAWAGQHGFTAQRSLTRMYLGENAAPGNSQKVFAIAAPEVG
ncbi:MAG: GNAT family N-acetyltransferase [Verrucomicrobia bacterium]|nr:GNAT family N-acetyltransferase [Verrucomicrobiota bacterium]